MKIDKEEVTKWIKDGSIWNMLNNQDRESLVNAVIEIIEEAREAQEILNEQNSNYWKDTCGSIK